MAHSSAAYAGPTYGVLMTAAEYLVLAKATVQTMRNSRLLKSEYQGSPSNLLCGICRCSPAGLVGIMQTRKVSRRMVRNHVWINEDHPTSRAEQGRDA